MIRNLEIPPEFGGSWEKFAQEWHVSEAFATGAYQVDWALATLCRLWPEKVTRLVKEPFRGEAAIAPAVELGSILRICERVNSFSDVLRRLKAGERSAYAEIVVVAALTRLGYTARFAAPIGGHVLDAACAIDGSPVYFEVVAPERSDALIVEDSVIRQLSEALRKSVSKCRVEVEVFRPCSEADISTIVDAIRSAPASSWVVIENTARLRRIDAGQKLLPAFDGDGMQVILGGERDVQGDSTGAIIRRETSDARAKRVFNQEYHQFAGDVANILVIDVCAVSGGMKEWPSLIAHLLQPTRNRKVGAVLFFDQGVLGPPEAIRRRWRGLVNPHAHIKIPEVLLADFESLDESHYLGLQRAERLVAV